MTKTDDTRNVHAWRADAARYHIMRRLVPSVNHKLAGSMQPITMLSSLLARHMQRDVTDPVAMGKHLADMQQACKDAIATRTDTLAWFQPSQQLTSIATGAAQCTNLLTADFAMRGCSIDNQTRDGRTVVPQDSVRTMLSAALFGILDDAAAPVAVLLQDTAPRRGAAPGVVASWTPLNASALEQKQDNIGHALRPDDVQAIADQLGVRLQRGDAFIEMHFSTATTRGDSPADPAGASDPDTNAAAPGTRGAETRQSDPVNMSTTMTSTTSPSPPVGP